MIATVLAVPLIAVVPLVLPSGSVQDPGLQVAAETAQAAAASAAKSSYRSKPKLNPPKMKVRKRSKRASNRKTFVGFKNKGAAIYAANGQPIWFLPSNSTDFRVQKYRGKPVLTWIQTPGKGSGIKRNTGMIANRNYKVIKRVYTGNGLNVDTHEFRLTGRGTAFLASTRVVRRNLSSFGLGTNAAMTDSIAQEINVRTGRVIWEWHSVDHVPIRDTFAVKIRRPGAPFDYFHINSIRQAPDGNIIISARSTNAVYKVSRKTGRIIWTLGGRSSDFRMGKGAYFSSQHDAELDRRGRMTIFDNGDSPVIAKPVRGQSRGLILKLNYRKMRAKLGRSYYHPGKPLASQQGNMQKLGGGHYFIGWGGVPIVSEHAAGGKLLYDAVFKNIGSFYRAFRSRWKGRPKTKISVASKVTGSDHTRMWVSWNGDSSVRRWRVFAGNRKNSLKRVANHRRKGFETSVKLRGKYRYLKVHGLSGSGKKLGRSRVVKSG